MTIFAIKVHAHPGTMGSVQGSQQTRRRPDGSYVLFTRRGDSPSAANSRIFQNRPTAAERRAEREAVGGRPRRSGGGGTTGGGRS